MYAIIFTKRFEFILNEFTSSIGMKDIDIQTTLFLHQYFELFEIFKFGPCYQENKHMIFYYNHQWVRKKYLLPPKDVVCKGPHKSGWINIRHEVALQALSTKNGLFICFPYTHPSHILIKLIFGNLETIYLSLSSLNPLRCRWL